MKSRLFASTPHDKSNSTERLPAFVGHGIKWLVGVDQFHSGLSRVAAAQTTDKQSSSIQGICCSSHNGFPIQKPNAPVS